MKAFKKTLALFLAFLMISSVCTALTFTASAETKLTIDDYDTTWTAASEIKDVYDLLAFAKANAGASVAFAKQIVKLGADIDVSNVDWPFADIEFGGIFEGNNHKIIGFNAKPTGTFGFFDYVHDGAVVRNLHFTDVNIEGTSTSKYLGVVARATYGLATFENVTVEGKISGGYGVTGFVGQVASGTTVFRNCISDVDVTSTVDYASGFVAAPNMSEGAVKFTDCAFIGSITSAHSEDRLASAGGSAGFVTCMAAGTSTKFNSSFTRCAVLGGTTNGDEHYAPLFWVNHANNVPQEIEINDCYVASPNGSVIGATANAAHHSISLKFGGKTVYYIANSKNTASMLDGFNKAFAENGGFLANGETVNVTKDNFAEKAVGLASTGKWVATDETVAYGAGNVVKALPNGTVAKDDTWGPVNGVYYIDDVHDMLAFFAAVTGDSAGNYFSGKTVKLRADIDMSVLTYTNYPVNQFNGNFDGQGHEIKGFTFSGNVKGVAFFRYKRAGYIKNVSFTDASVINATSDAAIVVGYTDRGTSDFENVYVSGRLFVIGANAGGLMARANGTSGTNANPTATITMKNCVSDVIIRNSSTGAAGFIANLAQTNTAVLEDCVFTGDMSVAHNRDTATFVGFATGNITMKRCVNLGNMIAVATAQGTSSGALVCLDHQNRTAATGYSEILIEDCYTACKTNLSPIGVDARGFKFTVNVKFGGTTVFTHTGSASETAANGIISKLADMTTAVKNAGMCLADGSTVNLTAENFATKCPALASGWAVTGRTVAYGGGNVPEILPRGIATDALSDTSTKALQIRDNGDTYDVRIVGTVNFADADAYDAVGFDYVVKVKGAETNITSGNFETDKVFSSITANGETVNATDPEIGAEGFNLIEFYEFGDDGVTYEITVLSYAKKDDVKTYNLSGAFTVCVKDGALAN